MASSLLGAVGVRLRSGADLWWRLALVGVSFSWWLVLATFALTGRLYHRDWWAYLEGFDSVFDESWQLGVLLAAVLAVALAWPWTLPRSGLAPPRGWRTWTAVALVVVAVPQTAQTAAWLRHPVLQPSPGTVAGRPDRPMLWIIVSTGDVGVGLPKLDVRRHDYWSVRYSPSVAVGSAPGIWAQICGDRLDAWWSGARHRCLVDEGWRVIHGRRDATWLNALLASTGAEVTGGDVFPGTSRVDDATLMEAAAQPHKLRHHVLVLADGVRPSARARDVAAADATMDAAVRDWVERGGAVLVTADHPRPRSGWQALPARLYGIPELALPVRVNEALALGKTAPGRLMGGLPYMSLYDVGCTAWDLAGFRCARVGYGVAITRQRSRTLYPFRSRR
ncbi:MAG: hypothetical protein OXG82_05575 [Gammaproteobacteria bacterium]|nr:hypothetical protein [Gammaproteobacteria bacterium]